MWPAAALDCVALNDTVWFVTGAVGENTNDAVGGGVGLVEETVTERVVVPVWPRSSVTTNTTLNVPALANGCVVVTPVAVPPSPKFQA